MHTAQPFFRTLPATRQLITGVHTSGPPFWRCPSRNAPSSCGQLRVLDGLGARDSCCQLGVLLLLLSSSLKEGEVPDRVSKTRRVQLEVDEGGPVFENTTATAATAAAGVSALVNAAARAGW